MNTGYSQGGTDQGISWRETSGLFFAANMLSLCGELAPVASPEHWESSVPFKVTSLAVLGHCAWITASCVGSNTP